MVGSHYHKSFVRMLLVEFISYFDCIIKILYLAESCCRIIAVASPVYFSALYHQEEPLAHIFRQEVDGRTCDILERQILFCSVNSIWNSASVFLRCFLALEKNHFVSFVAFLCIFIITSGYAVTIFVGHLVEVFSVFVFFVFRFYKV